MIAARKVVTLDYTLRNPEGEILDSSDGREPLEYLHGAHQIVPGLERALEGLGVGVERDIVVPPEDGYGPHDPRGVFPVPRSAFPAEASVSVGDVLQGEDEEGGTVALRVVGVDDEKVKVDVNHPLAGVTLHFHVAIRAIRDATSDELADGSN